MGNTRDPALHARWRQRMERYRRSELTVVEFCRREQVSRKRPIQTVGSAGGRAGDIVKSCVLRDLCGGVFLQQSVDESLAFEEE